MALDDFYLGKNLTTLNADFFAAQHIEPSMLTEDMEYQDTKWWDYRLLHPSVLTMYFAHLYFQIGAEILQAEVGGTEARSMRYLGAKYDLRDQPLATIRAMWRARMAADAMGVPYEVYLKGAFKNFRSSYKLQSTTKHKRNGRRQELPYATQLTNSFVMQAVLKEWEYQRAKEYQWPQHPDIPFNDFWFRPEMESWLNRQCEHHAKPDERRQALIDRGFVLRTN